MAAPHNEPHNAARQNWKNKVVFITGAGEPGDIGGATALAFAAQGAQLVLLDIDAKGFPALEKAIVATNAPAPLCLTGDVTSEESVKNALAQVKSRFGRLDAAFNNAGVAPTGKPVAEIPFDRWERVQKIDLSGVFLCLKYEIPLMLENGGGAIVNTASVLGEQAGCNEADYCAAKAGVIGLTRAAALDYATQKIRVNAVCPGAVETPLLLNALQTEAEKKKLAGEIPVGHPVAVTESLKPFCSSAIRA